MGARASIGANRMLAPIGRLPAGFLAVLVLAAAGCGSSSRGAEDVQNTWSSSRAAQRDFRRLAVQWSSLPAAQRVALEPRLASFLERYEGDPHTRAATVYLAWIHVQKGNLGEARRLARSVSKHQGVVYDFARVVEGAIFVREKLPNQALQVLEPLRGKIIDPIERLLFGGELVRAALQAKHYDAAIEYMVDWVEQAPTSDVETVEAEVGAMLQDAPVQAIERGLAVLEAEAAVEAEDSKSSRAAARNWLKKAARNRLVNAALADQDVSLARRLLDSTAPTFRRDDTGEALTRLASQGKVEPRVHGRAVGAVLRLSDDVSRRRSSQVIAGMSRGLGLPDASADPEAVRLVTEDLGEGDHAVEDALATLAGEGAAILVAAVAGSEIAKASVFAESAKIPVLLLDDSAALTATLDFTFVLGVDFARADEIARKFVADQRLNSVVVGPSGVPCRTTSLANEPPFPVPDWKKNHVDTVVLLGDVKCSRNAIAEIDRYKLQTTVVLGLESAELYSSLPSRPLLVASAGSFPSGLGPVPPSMHEWQSRLGSPPAWYEALGYDAATLAKKVLRDFPLERSDETKKVAELHRKARDALSVTSAELWTADKKGFAGARRVVRDVRIVAPAGTR